MDEREGYFKWKVKDIQNRTRIDYYKITKKSCLSQILKKEKAIIPQKLKAD